VYDILPVFDKMSTSYPSPEPNGTKQSEEKKPNQEGSKQPEEKKPNQDGSKPEKKQTPEEKKKNRRSFNKEQ